MRPTGAVGIAVAVVDNVVLANVVVESVAGVVTGVAASQYASAVRNGRGSTVGALPVDGATVAPLAVNAVAVATEETRIAVAPRRASRRGGARDAASPRTALRRRRRLHERRAHREHRRACAAPCHTRRDCAGEAKRHSASSSSMRMTWRACKRVVTGRLNCICRRRWLTCASSPACSQAWAISSSCCCWMTRVPSAATTRSRGSRFRSSSQVRVGARADLMAPRVPAPVDRRPEYRLGVGRRRTRVRRVEDRLQRLLPRLPSPCRDSASRAGRRAAARLRAAPPGVMPCGTGKPGALMSIARRPTECGEIARHERRDDRLEVLARAGAELPVVVDRQRDVARAPARRSSRPA